MNRLKFIFFVKLLLACTGIFAQVVLTSSNNAPNPGVRYVYNKIDLSYSSSFNSTNSLLLNLNQPSFLNDSTVLIYSNDSTSNPFPGYNYNAPPYYFSNSMFQIRNAVYLKNSMAWKQILQLSPSPFGISVGGANIDWLKYPFSDTSHYITSTLQCRPTLNFNTNLGMQVTGLANDRLIFQTDTVDALRVLRIDSCYANGGRVFIGVRNQQYEWYTTLSNLPILKLNISRRSNSNGSIPPPSATLDTSAYLLTSGAPNFLTKLFQIKDMNEGFNLYPNPVRTNLNLEFDQKHIEKIEVYNLNGVLEISSVGNNDKLRLDCSSLKAGSYVVKVTFLGGESLSKPFLKID